MTSIIAANWLNISINLLLVIHVIICLLLALVVLMQRPKQEGLGAAFGGGLTDQAFGARTTDVLQKGTVYLGTLFFVITLILAILIGKRQSQNPTLTVDPVEQAEEVAEPEELPEVPAEAKPAVQMPQQPASEKKAEEETKNESTADQATAPDAAEPAAPAEGEVTPAEAEAAQAEPAESAPDTETPIQAAETPEPAPTEKP